MYDGSPDPPEAPRAVSEEQISRKCFPGDFSEEHDHGNDPEIVDGYDARDEDK